MIRAIIVTIEYDQTTRWKSESEQLPILLGNGDLSGSETNQAECTIVQ